MDAHVTAHLPVEEESPAPSVRVPAETAEPFAERGFRKEGPEPGVRLPGEVEEPSLGESFEECSGISMPTTRTHLPAVARSWWGRPRTLLLGAAVIAFCVAGATAFFAYNHASPVPQMASTLRHWAAEMGVKRTEPLAPAASLAGVPTEPAEPVTREKYQPKRKDQQLEEVLALQNRAPQGSRGDGQPANGAPAVVAPLSGQAAGASDRDAPPPGYIPSEPGTNPASLPAGPRVQPAVEATGSAPPAPAVTPPALPAGEPPHDATTDVLTSLGQAPQSPRSSSPSPAPPAQAGVAPPAALPVKPDHPAETAGELRSAPLTPADQVQVLELVTQMAAMVRDLRAQHAQLRADFGKTAADNAARLADFERRLALAEARHALSAAQIAGEPLSTAPPASAPATEGAPAAVGSGAGQAGSATAVTVPVVVTPAAMALPGSDKGPPKRYRVQAASPGLALLAEVDRGGGDGAQLEVLVGDTVPGYGKITSIGQRGTAWVVTTEHGTIQ
jgi:hypothetical protein